jgi:hypothetical protein
VNCFYDSEGEAHSSGRHRSRTPFIWVLALLSVPELQGAIEYAGPKHCVVTHFVSRQYVRFKNI